MPLLRGSVARWRWEAYMVGGRAMLPQGKGETTKRVGDVACWNMLIGACVDSGHHDAALRAFRHMQQEEVTPNAISFVSALRAVGCPSSAPAGRLLHAHVLGATPFASHLVVGTALLTMYSKCGGIRHAYKVFRSLPRRDTVSWNAMLAGYALSGPDSTQTLKLYLHMQRDGVAPNKITFLNILKACRSDAALALGKLAHAHAAHLGIIDPHGMLGTAAVDMYCKCGRLDQACAMFNRLPEQDVVSWNAIITGCQQGGHGDLALRLFWQMQNQGVHPNGVTFVVVLNVCASLASQTHGKLIHANIVDIGMEWNTDVGTALVDMYSKCGNIDDAHRVFEKLPEQTVFSWSVIISAYVQHGLAKEAMRLFQNMQCQGVKPDKFTFSSIVTACASLASLTLAKELHAQIIKSGCELDIIMGNALVNMFVKCSSIEDAHVVFDKMPYRDVASWTALISGYAEDGRFDEAFTLFQEMQRQGIKPNDITFISWLKACVSHVALREGRLIHAYIVNCGIQQHLRLENALIEMYAKCGSINDARSVFEKMHTRDIISWTVMITGCAHHGCSMEALQLFEQMKLENIDLDNVIFSSILAACNHAGLVEEGSCCFKLMIEEYGILPTMQHCAGMIDLFGRSGHLDEAESFINQMACQPSLAMWVSLLVACRNYGNVVLAELTVKCILETEDQNAAMYTLLANVYATYDRWNNEAKVREVRN